MDDVNDKIAQISELCEIEQARLEEEQERNNDQQLLKRQKETTMNLKQDHNKIKNDITLANNRIKELETTREILNQAIQDILKDKRKIDKYNMELEDKISGRNVTDLQTKQNYKNEERKMRIKYEKNLDTLKKTGVNLVDKGGDEETQSKEVLDEKLKLEQDLLDLNDELNVMFGKQSENRENLIKFRVKNSQLDTQLQMLQIEE